MVEQGSVSKPEILDIRNFAGVYVRFLLASQDPSLLPDIINPNLSFEIPTEISILTIRGYTPLTPPNERIEAWNGLSFRESYTKWETKLVSLVNSTSEGKRADAIKFVSGKSPSEFNSKDVGRLYALLCDGKSDTTTYINSIVEGLSTDGKVDLQKLTDLQPGLEWFSAQFFGKSTSKAITKMVELQAEIVNNPKALVQKLFLDKDRLNSSKLTDPEKEMLATLHDGLIFKRPLSQPGSSTQEVPPISSDTPRKRQDILQQPTTSTQAERPDYPSAEYSYRFIAPLPQPSTIYTSITSALTHEPDASITTRTTTRTRRTPVPIEIAVPDDVSEISGDNLIEDLNSELSDQESNEAYYLIPVGALRNFFVSIAGENLKSEGEFEIDYDKNEIYLRGLQAEVPLTSSSVDFSARNSRYGLVAQIITYKARGIQRPKREVDAKLTVEYFRRMFDEHLTQDSPTWRPDKIFLVGGDKILVHFKKIKVKKTS